MGIIKINLELFSIYRFDEDCWGASFLSCGIMGNSLFSIDSDEDGLYLNLLWIIEMKIKDKKNGMSD